MNEDPKTSHVMPTCERAGFYHSKPALGFIMELIMNERTIGLIGQDNLEKIKNKHVLVVGLGGVGGITVESLVRSGVGKITVIDNDFFDESNLNRQILATSNNIGNNKCSECIRRMKSINPSLDIKGMPIFLDQSNMDCLEDYDYIIDACDTINTKVLLVKYAQDKGLKIISCMGTGKRLDPSKIEIGKLNKTFNDPLAKVMRKKIKDEHLNGDVDVVFSKELPLNNDANVSSMMFVPNVAGIMMANYVINDIIKNG